MRSIASACAATGASWRSTATRIASTSSIAKTRPRSSPNSTAPAAGATRKSSRSTPSCAELADREIPAIAPLVLEGATLHHDDELRFARVSEARRPHARARRPRHARPGSAASSAASTRSARSEASSIAPRSTSHRSATSRATSCLPTASCRTTCAKRTAASRPWRWPAFVAASTAQATCVRCGCTATATRAMCFGRTDGPHFVDFDDARTGPAMQDLWMLLSGDRASMTRQLGDVLAGYEDFAELDRARAPSRRGAAYAAPPPLLGMDRATLGRPRVSRRLSVVQHAALLAGPHPRAARADRGDGRAAARGLSVRLRPA